jgi:hypothetical protein
MIDERGNCSGKYGIHARAEFLADHEAQEKALIDLLHETERQLRANHAFDFVGRTLEGLNATFPITRAGLIAAAHREGAQRDA